MVMGMMTMNKMNLQTLEHTSFKRIIGQKSSKNRDITTRGYQGESYISSGLPVNSFFNLDIKGGWSTNPLLLKQGVMGR